MISRWAASWVAALGFTGATAFAQVPAQSVIQTLGYTDDGSTFVTNDGSVVIQGEMPQVAVSNSAPSNVPPTPRLEKLRRLEFDRRPSTILNVWSTPPKPKTEAKPEAAPAPDAKSAEPAPSEPAPNSATAAKPAEAKPEAAQPDAAKTPPDPEAAKKKAEAEAAKKKAEEAAKKKAEEAKAIDAEMEALKRNVTLGDWAAVKAYFAGLTKEEKSGGYDRLLQSLAQGPPPPPNVNPMLRQFAERNRFSPEDVVGLAAAAPDKLSTQNENLLGNLLRQALDQGHQIDAFVAAIGPRLDSEGFPLARRQVARVLVAAGQVLSIESYVPSFETCEKDNDPEGQNLRARLAMANFERDGKTSRLADAWDSTQAVLARADLDDAVKREALKRAVEIAPRVKAELGQAWLDESFTKRPERGIEILATIGSAAASAITTQPMDDERRFKLLELQTTAAKALLAAAPERAQDWRSELGLLADNWLAEANVTYQYDRSTSLGPRMQRDTYGNIYYWDEYGNYNYRNEPVKAISTAKLLDIRPSDEWLAHVDPTLRPRFNVLFAELYLKVGAEAKAFPYIEGLATTLPKPAKALVDEFLRVWTKNHDANTTQQRTNPYVYFYGFEQRANGIPLTRSKQERNLKELGECLTRLRKLPVELDDALIAQAFASVHSSAEVFRLELVEQIFGPIKDLKPATLAQLLETMRVNLASVWRDPAQQEKNKTKRNQKDIQAEIQHGYEVANKTIDEALAEHGESWELWRVKAAVLHDANNFNATLAKDADFSKKREAAFVLFRKAAELYAGGAAQREKEKETTEVYDTWFYAALGASDLKAVDFDQTLATNEIARIRDAIAALPGDSAERHTGMFANALFSRMSSAAPAVKYRYVREGLSIVGDHPLAREAREVYDYYKDLVTEIQLHTFIDGTDRVSVGEPFGLRVDLRHTQDIERESGGFSKYLQNQNAANFGYNYGRPTEDYRDRFEETARAALKENFEVLSVTFNDPQVKSRADAQYGWRITPYAYLLLKPRGPQIDRIPPLRLDLDFLDTSGYAVLPIESAAIPIDATQPKPDARPFAKVALTQSLDERQAKDGKLILEVKAAGQGLMPSLAELVDFAPKGFEIAKTDDHGVSVVKFDDAADAIDSERTWTINLRGLEGATELPDTFDFAKPRIEVANAEQFRYVDADLVSVKPSVSLEHRYGTQSRAWLWWTLGALVAVVGGVFAWRATRKPQIVEESRYRVPESLTPFTVLGLLRNIEANNGLDRSEKSELSGEIAALERHYFGDDRGAAPDLEHIARRWVERSD